MMARWSGQLVGLLTGLVLGTTLVQAQAWTQSPGRTYLKLSQQRSGASEQYRRDGSRAPYASGLEVDGYEDRSRYLYVEYGLTKRFTMVASVPYKVVTVRTPHPQASSGLPGTDRPLERGAAGLENIYLGVRRSLNDAFNLPRFSRHAVALNLGVRLPSGYDRASIPALGPGQVDFELTGHYGLSLWPAPGYLQAGAGFRARSGLYGLSQGDTAGPDYGNEWLLHAEAGASIGRWVLLQAMLFGTVSNQRPETAFDPANPVPLHQRFVKTGVGATLHPTPWVGLSLQVFGTPWGANTVRSTDWFWGLEIAL